MAFKGQAEGVDAKCYPASFEGTDTFLRVPDDESVVSVDSRRGQPVHHNRGWWGRGMAMDWYLSPTGASGYNFTKALFTLTGAPAVPPRYAMGFMATYWGYRSMSEVEGYMQQFRNLSFPIDSFIMDYDWFGNTKGFGMYM